MLRLSTMYIIQPTVNGRTTQIGHQTTCNLSLILLVTFQEYNNLTFPKFQVTKQFNKIRKAKSVLIKTFKFD